MYSITLFVRYFFKDESDIYGPLSKASSVVPVKALSKCQVQMPCFNLSEENDFWFGEHAQYIA